MDEFINFIEEKPLYFRLTEGIPEKKQQIYPDKIEFYCSVCKTNRPFHKPGYGKGKYYVGQESGNESGVDREISAVFSEIINSLSSGISSRSQLDLTILWLVKY